jgi:uncharacterized protein YbjT (DUF2867 family)
MSSEKEIIVVTGATGNIGKPIVENLIERGYAPRVIVRKLEANSAWNSAGVVQKVADLSDAESLAQAFEGAERVFSLSPFVENLVELGTATVEAAKRAGVKRIVRSSAQGADVNAPIAMGRWHGAVEKIIEDSGLEWTFVQPASFFQNYLGFADTIKNQNAFYAPLGSGKISLVDVRDIAAVSVAALTEDHHAGKKYAVTGGESLSNNDIAEIFSGVLGRAIKYVDAPEEQARKQMLDSKMPAWMVDAVMELNRIGKAGYLAETRSTVEEVTGRKPRTFREFAVENKSAFQ